MERRTVLPRDPSPEDQIVFEDIAASLGFGVVPNFFRYQAGTFLLAASWSVVRAILVAEHLVARVLKEAIVIAISRATRCRYCELAHLALCTRLDYEDQLTDQMEFTGRDAALIELGVLIAIDKTSHDVERLCTRHVVTAAEYQELVSLAALSLYLNTIADGLGIPIDPDLAAQAALGASDHALMAILDKLDQTIAIVQRMPES